MSEVVAKQEAAVEEAVKPREKRRKKPKRQPPYNVILWNDDDHTFQYVIEMMAELFAHPLEKGFEIAEQVHLQGRAIALTTTKEHAELKRDQIHAYGKDRAVQGCLGSMFSTIEPAN